MKRLKYIVAICSAAFMFSSCASDWLDTEPTSSVGTSTVFESTDNAAMVAITGYYKYMDKEFCPMDAAPFSRVQI